MLEVMAAWPDAGAPPEPVTAMHSSYRVLPSPHRSIHVIPFCQWESADSGFCTASQRPYGSGVKSGPSTTSRGPATIHRLPCDRLRGGGESSPEREGDDDQTRAMFGVVTAPPTWPETKKA